MLSKNLLSAALVSVVGLASTAHGAIVANPPYSGPMSTFQCWDFLTPDPNAPADAPFDNHFGTPKMHVDGQPQWLPGQFGKQGVWQLNPNAAGTGDALNFDIPNMADPNSRKLIWLEVKYFGLPGTAFLPPIVSGQSVGSPVPPETVTFTGHSTRTADNQPDWSIDTWVGYLDHCPPLEELTVAANPNASNPTLIDYVCINTICVPTPGTGMLMAASAMVLGVRRRRA